MFFYVTALVWMIWWEYHLPKKHDWTEEQYAKLQLYYALYRALISPQDTKE